MVRWWIKTWIFYQTISSNLNIISSRFMINWARWWYSSISRHQNFFFCILIIRDINFLSIFNFLFFLETPFFLSKQTLSLRRFIFIFNSSLFFLRLWVYMGFKVISRKIAFFNFDKTMVSCHMNQKLFIGD